MRPLTLLVLLALMPFRADSAEVDALGESSQAASRPEWIWTDKQGTDQSIHLRRKFSVTGRVTESRLRLAADFCRCRIQINGRAVTSLDDYGPWLDQDVTEFLRDGENVIRILADGSRGPSAIAAELAIHPIGGAPEFLRSDETWTARVTADSGPDDDESDWSPAAGQGPVASRYWNAETRGRRITAFDDYTQWKRASDGGGAVDPAKFATRPGFEIERIRGAEPDEGSWVSMAFDSLGRLTIAREDKGLLRFGLNRDGDEVVRVETINDTLLECRGLLYAYDALYANANNSKAMYRLRDTDGDDQFDDVKLLREFPGSVGHGRNDLALGPDGLIYSIHGDAVDVPLTDILDHTSPFRESRRGRPQREGHLVRCDRNGENWELLAAGLRNPFGIDFNKHGDLFTYDADAEFDMGAPWYRPTRIDHLVSGADFGWRGLTRQWPPYRLDHADNALPVSDIGKGSPTAVKSGRTSAFPDPWRDAMFVLDWAYGRIVACHMYPRGAGYVCRAETFLKGRPLNVTDLDFGPDGSMYVITGGRKTESSLYRVRYTGEHVAEEQRARHQIARETFSTWQRSVRWTLRMLHDHPVYGAIPVAWQHLANPDPTVRHAARVAIEHQPIDEWKTRALSETDPATAIVALLALSRGADAEIRSAILERLNRISTDGLSAFDRLSLLESYRLCLPDPTASDDERHDATRDRLWRWLLSEIESSATPPVGAGAGVVQQLSALVAQFRMPEATPVLSSLLRRADSQQERMHYLFLLRHTGEGWSVSDRRSYFEALRELDQTALGGDGMPGFLRRIREEAFATLTDDERQEFGELIKAGADAQPETASIDRAVVREWSLDDLDSLLAATEREPDPQTGRELYSVVLCSRCHRIAGRGRMVGPDLTSVTSRFSRRDILTSILEPSRVVAEKYRNVQVVTADGRSIVGRVAPGGDYRSPTLRIATDPLDPTQIVEIKKIEIDVHQDAKLSPMPKGLLNTLTRDEILTLLDFMESAADFRSRPDSP